jgi:hypothetical protein
MYLFVMLIQCCIVLHKIWISNVIDHGRRLNIGNVKEDKNTGSKQTGIIRQSIKSG